MTDNGSTMYTARTRLPATTGASLEGITPTLTYYSGTNATGTALSGAPTAASTYTVLASFAGSTDYTSGTASTTFTIFASTVSTPTVSVTDSGGTYNGGAFTATIRWRAPATTGPSLEGMTPGLTYFLGTSASGTVVSGAPTSAGTYTVLASFAGSTDYTSGTASTTFTISQATPTVSVTDSGGTYTGSPFTAWEWWRAEPDDRQPGRDHSDADLLHWQHHGHGVERCTDFGGHVHGSGQLRRQHRLHVCHQFCHDLQHREGRADRDGDRYERFS